jgi:hypothetical protein
MQNRVRWTRGGSAEVSKFEPGTHGFSGTSGHRSTCGTYLSARRLKSQGPDSAPAASPVVRASCDQPACLTDVEVFADCSDPLPFMTGTPGPKFQPTAPFPSRRRDVAGSHGTGGGSGTGRRARSLTPRSLSHRQLARQSANGYREAVSLRRIAVRCSPLEPVGGSLRSSFPSGWPHGLHSGRCSSVTPAEPSCPLRRALPSLRLTPPRAGRRSFVPRNPFGAGHPGFVSRG